MHLTVVAANLGRFSKQPYLTRRASDVALVVDRQFDVKHARDLIADLRSRFKITSMDVIYVDPDPDELDCQHGVHDYRGVHANGDIIGARCERCGAFVATEPIPVPDRVLVRGAMP